LMIDADIMKKKLLRVKNFENFEKIYFSKENYVREGKPSKKLKWPK
jgi:hypothetical protein